MAGSVSSSVDGVINAGSILNSDSGDIGDDRPLSLSPGSPIRFAEEAVKFGLVSSEEARETVESTVPACLPQVPDAGQKSEGRSTQLASLLDGPEVHTFSLVPSKKRARVRILPPGPVPQETREQGGSSPALLTTSPGPSRSGVSSASSISSNVSSKKKKKKKKTRGEKAAGAAWVNHNLHTVARCDKESMSSARRELNSVTGSFLFREHIQSLEERFSALEQRVVHLEGVPGEKRVYDNRAKGRKRPRSPGAASGPRSVRRPVKSRLN